MSIFRRLKRWLAAVTRPSNPTFAQMTDYDGLGLTEVRVAFNERATCVTGAFAYPLAELPTVEVAVGDVVVGYDGRVFCVGLLRHDVEGRLCFSEESFFAPMG